MSWTYVVSHLNGEEIVGSFYGKGLQETNQREFRVAKVIKKSDKPYVKWKGHDNFFNSWVNKKPKFFGRRVKLELDLSIYTTKADLKNAAGVNTSKAAKKFDLTNLKSNVDKKDIDKLKDVNKLFGFLKFQNKL